MDMQGWGEEEEGEMYGESNMETYITICKKDKCTPMFIAALFTIARIWKQPRCPSTDEWIKKLWYIYAMEYYSVIKGMHLSRF